MGSKQLSLKGKDMRGTSFLNLELFLDIVSEFCLANKIYYLFRIGVHGL